MNKYIPLQHEIEALKIYFNTAPGLSDVFFNDMLPRWDAIKTKRKQLLSNEGDIEHYLYVVIEGVQRCFYTHNNREATIIFSYPTSFTGVVDSFLTQKPANSNFETLTESRLLRLHYKDFDYLCNQYPEFERWLRLILSHTLQGVLERQKELSMYSAAEKLETLFKRSPHLFNLIPDKYIASYIGVDPATLSKMLNKIIL
ncbi:MAG: Crp/Fnr family transcriptional regulator [Sphingobacteriaceae bacterium]|nr:MAG: Crp/Fnr family transcriptional regulator [Sphingobacteriaceae bacterium]